MPVRLSILISIIVIVSCNSSENRYSNSQDKNDSMGAAKTKLSERINGPSGSLNVDDGGNGDIPVVFLHSFGGGTTNWKNQLDELRKSRRAIAIDLRGHGKSDILADNEY